MSYRLRLIITIVLLIAVTFSIGGSVLICASFRIFLGAETEASLDSYKAVMNTLCLLNAVDNHIDEGALADALAQITGAGNRSWQAISLWSGENLIYQSGPELLRDQLLPPEEYNRCAWVQVSDQYGRGLVITSQLKIGGDSLRLLGRFDLSRVYGARTAQQHLYGVSYLVMVVVGMVTAVILSFALTKKLRRLTGAVKRIARGDLSTRSRLSSGDEFGVLSRNFDAMADKLQENIAMLEGNIERQESFMGSFAHELKTPMTSIIGFADLLRQGNLDENTRMMAAEYIYSEGHRLERLSFKLLDLLLLKKDAVTMKPLWLPAFVTEIHKALAPGLRDKGVRLVCRGEQGTVFLEPDLVKSLLYNLIDNASKAMDGDGLIVLKAEPTSEGVLFQVVDNGHGMEKEELSKITDAFYRVDKVRSRAQGGAGLGLALCKQIVALHNGTIRFASVPGKGTSVRVTLCGKAGEARE